MTADKILARLEKLRYAWLDYGDRPMVFSQHLDAAIADVRALLQPRQTVPVRVDDRWRALLAEMRSYNSFEARCADRIESLLTEPVTVGNRVTSVNTDCWPDGPQMPDYEEEIAEAEADAAMADAEGDAEYGEANGAK